MNAANLPSAIAGSPRAQSEEALNCKPSRSEWVGLILILTALLLVDLLTYNYYPAVWCDDVTWSESAINLATTGHFTTSVWQFQPAGTFWAVNPPLYCFLLSGWVHVFGSSLLAVRSFNFVLFKAAIILVWMLSWKGGFARKPWQRFTLVVLLGTGYGMSFSYRCSRPDILGMACVMALWLAFFIQTTRTRRIALFIISALSVWIGLQVAMLTWICCFGAWVFFRRVTLPELVVILLGLVVGTASLVVFYAWNQALPYLFVSVFHVIEKAHGPGASGYLIGLLEKLKSMGTWLSDFSLIPLVLGLLYFWKHGAGFAFTPATRQTIRAALMIVFGIPLIFDLTGHFAFYYSYMLFVPVLLAFCRAHSDLLAAEAATSQDRTESGKESGLSKDSQSRVGLQLAFGLPVLLAILIGLPFRLLLTGAFCQVMPRSKIGALVRSSVRPEDIVFSDYGCFFEAKQIAHNVYSPMYSKDFMGLSERAHGFSTEERQRITVMIVRPEEQAMFGKYFGGEWTAVSPAFGDSCSFEKLSRFPFLRRKLEHHFERPQAIRCGFQVFRRVG